MTSEKLHLDLMNIEKQDIDFLMDFDNSLHVLSDKEALILDLFYFQGLSTHEIVKETQINYMKIRSLLKSALAKVNAEMNGLIKDYVVIDVETTGLEPDTEQIIEIAAIRYDVEGNEVGCFHNAVMLEEGKELTPFIKELTGITEYDLRYGLYEDQAIEALNYFICDSVVVGHNVLFDLSFMQKKITGVNYLCTKHLAKILEPNESSKLADVTVRYGIHLKGHHRALNDVRATGQVFQEIRKRLALKGLHEADYLKMYTGVDEHESKRRKIS